MLGQLPATKQRRTIAADKSYDTKDFVADVRKLGFTPHVAQNTSNRRSAIDGRTTRHDGYTVSQRIRKRVEEPFGWIKTVGAARKLRYIGEQRNRALFKMEAARLQPDQDLQPRRRSGLNPRPRWRYRTHPSPDQHPVTPPNAITKHQPTAKPPTGTLFRTLLAGVRERVGGPLPE